MVFPLLLLDAPHARAALQVEVARAAPGKPFLAAVEISTDPHWHVYWRNPGDSGVPTRIEWGAPRGWKVEPLEFPVPRRFAPGGIAAYGYEGKTLFLAWVTPSKTPGRLSAKASWLVCKEACVQGAATVVAKLPLGSTKPGPYAKPLRAALGGLPRSAVGWTLRAVQGSKGVVLTATPKGSAAVYSLFGKPWFFPSESGVVDQAEPLVATLQGNSYVFKMKASPFPESRDRLKGLLVYKVKGATNGARVGLVVAPKLEREK